MARAKKLPVVTTFDGRQFRTGMQQMKADLKGVSKGVGQLGNIMKAGLAGAGVAAVMDGVKSMQKMVIAADQLNKKTSIVFGAYEKDVNRVAEASARGLGMSKDEFRAAASATADLLVPMKFTRGEATNMSLELVKLSGALSEWSNGQYDASETSQIITKAMLGETEQMKQLGIKVDQTSKAFNKQVKELMQVKGLSLEQAKAMAILEQITNKSADAQQAFAENAGSVAREAAEARAIMQDWKDNVIKELIPLWNKNVTATNDFLTVVGHLKDEISSGWDEIGGADSVIKDWVERGLLAIVTTGASEVQKAMGGFADEIERANKNAAEATKPGGWVDLLQEASKGGLSIPSFQSTPGEEIRVEDKLVDDRGADIAKLGEKDLPEEIEIMGKNFKDYLEPAVDILGDFKDLYADTADEVEQSNIDIASSMASFAGDFKQNSLQLIKQLANQALAGYLASIFKSQELPVYVQLAMAAAASSVINGLFSSIGGRTGGGGGSTGHIGSGAGIERRAPAGQNVEMSGVIVGDNMRIMANRNQNRINRINGG